MTGRGRAGRTCWVASIPSASLSWSPHPPPRVTPVCHYQRMPIAQLDENDLLRHTSIRQVVHGNEAVWIRSISSNDDDAIVSISLDNINLVGHSAHLIERLEAAVALIRSAMAQPDRWHELEPRQRGDRMVPGVRPHPFSDRPRNDRNSPSTIEQGNR